MKCLKCGAEIEDNSKFCGYCGNVVEVPQVQPMASEVPQAPAEPAVNAAPVQEPQQVQEPVANEIPEPQPVAQPVVNEIPEAPAAPAPVQEQPVQPQTQPVITEEPVTKGKKKGGLVAVIIIAVLALAAAAVFLVMSMGGKKSSESSIDVLEKAIKNMVVSDSSSISKSGTVSAKLLVSDGKDNSLTLQANLKYQRLTESVVLELNVPTNPFIEDYVDGDIVLYALFKDDTLGLYTKSNIIDAIVEVETDSVTWVNYIVEDINIEEMLEEIKTEDTDSTMELKLSEIIPENKFVLAGTDNNVRHYVLTIDNELLKGMKEKAKKIETKATTEERPGVAQYINALEEVEINDTYKVDFYINDKDVLTKIEFDFSDLIEDTEVSKALLSIEFKDLNNTVVTIPSDALNNSVDIMTYMSELQNNEEEDDEEL